MLAAPGQDRSVSVAELWGPGTPPRGGSAGGPKPKIGKLELFSFILPSACTNCRAITPDDRIGQEAGFVVNCLSSL